MAIKDDYTGLSDEEIEALEAETDEPEDTEDEDDDGGTEETGTGEEAEETPPAVGEPAAEPAAEQAEPQGKDEPPQVEEQEFRPQVTATADLAGEEKRLTEALEDLGRKFDEGEIDHTEYHREMLKLNRELTKVQIESDRLTVQAEQETQRWNWEVERFLEDNKQFANPLLNGALSAALNQLYAEEASAGRSYRWYLNEAAGRVREAMGLAQAPQPKPEARKPAKPVKPTAQAIPQTLGGLPAAGEPDVGQDRFAYIDRLSGAKLEAALLSMSDADQAEYLDTRRIHA